MRFATAIRGSARTDAPPAAWYALGVLTVVTLFAFLDRGVLSLQAELIRKSLGLTDLQLGLLQGTGVAIFAAVAGYPLGWLADRFDRRLVLAGCALFWSAAVVGSGLAQTFEQLALASALVGAGEAGLVPIVYAMIPELFGATKRQLANSVYTLASTATGALSLAVSGVVIGHVESLRHLMPLAVQSLDGWRLSFLVAALPAPVMALLIATISLHRTRPAADETALVRSTSKFNARAVSLRAFLSEHRRAFLGFYAAVGIAAFGFNAVGGWLIVIYGRVFGQTPQQVGTVLGGIAIVATAIGFVVSVYGVRHLSARFGERLNVRSLGLASLLAALAFLLMPLASTAQQLYAIQGLYIVLLTSASMIYPSALQNMAPDHLRGRIVAITLVVATAAAAIAPPVTGVLSDQFTKAPNGLILAAVLVSVPALLLSAVLFYWCESEYVKTTQAVRTMDLSSEVEYDAEVDTALSPEVRPS